MPAHAKEVPLMVYYTVHLFHELPIGTRFLYEGAMHIKLGRDAAQCVDERSDRYPTVFFMNPITEVLTA
jgi:hypothetical protein